MLDFSKVKFAVLGWFEKFKNQPIVTGCKHPKKFKEQTWVRTSSKHFKLKNRYTCDKCDSTDLRDIVGE